MINIFKTKKHQDDCHLLFNQQFLHLTKNHQDD